MEPSCPQCGQCCISNGLIPPLIPDEVKAFQGKRSPDEHSGEPQETNNVK